MANVLIGPEAIYAVGSDGHTSATIIAHYRYHVCFDDSDAPEHLRCAVFDDESATLTDAQILTKARAALPTTRDLDDG